MLGHNETQLDSYNKNIPKTSGKNSSTQALSSPTGMKNECIEKKKGKVEQSPKHTNLKNIKIYYSQGAFQLLPP